MTDRELLELAAKAAGVEVTRSRLEDPLNRDMLVENSVRNGGQRLGPWNPLTDDGDALRLTVKLGLTVSQLINNREVEVNDYDETVFVNEFHEPDPCAATRRAIVRAAAEVGRNMT